MINKRRAAVATIVTATLGLAEHDQIRTSLSLAIKRWRDDPAATATDIGLSAIGQLMFYTVGQDFIGFGMNKKYAGGLGHKLAPIVYRRLPATATAAWIVKTVEILSDASRIPIETRLYRENGIVPDAVAALFTQPGYTLLYEVGEKTIGCINHPERVHDANQVVDSLSSIYGSWTRNLLSLWLYFYGDSYRSHITKFIKQGL